MSTEVEAKIRELFKSRYSLYDLRRTALPKMKRAEATRIILSTLGFKDANEYEMAMLGIEKAKAELIARQSMQWADEEKTERMKTLFEEGHTLREIRVAVFPEETPERTRNEVNDDILLKTAIILRALNLGSRNDFMIARENLLARKKRKKRRDSGYFGVRASILERDNSRCVVTGSTLKLEVHHIDGDESNNNPANLVTVSKKIQTILHNGVRAMVPKDIEYWQRRAPQYAEHLREGLDLMQKYVAYIRSKGHESARVECISGEHLFGPTQYHRKLHINDRRKRPDYGYWVAVLEPTGFHEEPEEFVPRGYSDWDEEDDEDDLGSDELYFNEGLEDEN